MEIQKVIINVTESDIQKSMRSSYCPIERALARAFSLSLDDVSVGHSHFRIYPFHYVGKLPIKLCNWILDFDSGKTVSIFEAEIEYRKL